jgi:hypothetical protein
MNINFGSRKKYFYRVIILVTVNETTDVSIPFFLPYINMSVCPSSQTTFEPHRLSWLLRSVVLWLHTNVSEEHTVSKFRVELDTA